MKSTGPLIIILLLVAIQGYGQGGPVTSPTQLLGQTKAITTAVPFLLISPDARHAAMGDVGVASSPDANSAYWNAGKLAFIDKAYGGTLSYTPWLGKIINDMSISYLSGFYKLTREQTFSVGFKYFDLGDIFFTENGKDGTNFNPREFAFDFTYSRMLTENLGVGLTGRYVHSNLTGAYNASGSVDAQAGKSAAADVGVYYSKDINRARNSKLSLGASISNIGAKLTYTGGANKDFLPTNLRLGSAYKVEIDPYNSFTFLLDFNKLMVPSVNKNQALLKGMFGSFGDATDGGKEELQEIITNLGLEYWYHEIFAARLGYFLESFDKGNRKYLTLGAGFQKSSFGLDVAYLVPTNKREHPLAETLRFTLLFTVPQRQEVEKTVTEE